MSGKPGLGSIRSSGYYTTGAQWVFDKFLGKKFLLDPSNADKRPDLPLDLALYQPEIAQNAGAAVRVAACFEARLHVIEPCGFPLEAKGFRRTAMDYGLMAPPALHASWAAFKNSEARRTGRLILLTTKASEPHHDFAFAPGDILMIGQESAGVPDAVRKEADAAIRIPLAVGARSLNMSVAAAVGLSEARRQLGFAPRPLG